ncbi:MAG: holo-ACP synthase [Hyphomicrobium sp.]|nr:holo-ACP synthase [Hyphomicrobium sp.]
MGDVIGHGVDIIELQEFERQLAVPGDHLLLRCFTDDEIAYAGNGPHRVQRLAARFAAKEAVLKSLGTGWVSGISWKDIEVKRELAGAPVICVTGKVAALAQDRGIGQFLISLSHSRSFAIASVMAIRQTISSST